MSEITSDQAREHVAQDLIPGRHAGFTLALRQDALAEVTSWTTLSDDDLKRRATRAARDRDLDTLWELTSAYMTLHAARASALSPHTRRAYRRGLEDALVSLEASSLLDPGTKWALRYRAELSARLAPASCAVRLAAAKTFYAALRWSGASVADPFRDVGGVHDPTPPWHKRDAYRPEELDTLLSLADPRGRLIVLLGAHAGLRAGDMARLLPGDVDETNATITITDGKGGKNAVVNASDSVLEAFRGYNPTHGKASLFGVSSRTVWQIVYDLCTRAGVRALGVQSLRHSSGTRLYHETGDIMQVRDHLRHASVKTSERYAKSDERVRTRVRSW